ncbi:MAG: RDD family protein, partial [Planctomycetes bacterium]|nr:RDD family protein [Planctomycetota bacterium]
LVTTVEVRAQPSVEVRTPEGVPLRFHLATVGDRAAAFLVDGAILFVLAIGFGLVIELTTMLSSGAVNALIQLVVFLVFAFYFPAFEILWRGRTPGKRLVGIQVIDANGRTLTGEAIFARNLTRKVEVVFPLILMANPRLLWPDAPGWAVLLSFGWLLVLLFLPLFNQRRQRAGDFLASTIVIRRPKIQLLRDLTLGPAESESRRHHYRFEPAELDLYGIFELQTLEQVLRTREVKPKTLRDIAEKICRKMRRQESRLQPRRFLDDFYAQLRRHLEQKLLFGERQERKKEGRLER